MSPRLLLAELAATGRQARNAWSFLGARQKAGLSAAVALMLLAGFLTSRIPLLLGSLVDAVDPRAVSLSSTSPYLAGIAGALVALALLNVARRVVVERTATEVERNASVAAIRQLLMTELTQLKENATGTLGGRVSRSVSGLVKLLKLAFLDAFPATAGAAFAIQAAFGKHLFLGLLMSGVVPLGLFVVLLQLSSQRGIRLSLVDAKEQMDGILVEQLGGIDSIRAAHTLEHEVDKVGAIAEVVRRREFRHHVSMAWFDAAKSLNEGAFYLIVVTAAIWLCASGELTPGDILAAALLFAAVLSPLREIHRILDEAHESGLRAETFFKMLHHPADPSFSPSDPHAVDLAAETMIEIDGLEVEWKTKGREVKALDGLSLSLRAGEVVGVAGPSGSGKSTLVQVLLRLVHPSAGTVRIGGADLERLSREQIAGLIGYVSQSPYLFTGTIAENISYGSQDTDLNEVMAAAKLANLHHEIVGFPDGYLHRVGERGENLSGGQRQRLALARVFLSRPPILILDEATAALDNDNERAVMSALNRAVEGRTVLMIAHRLTSLERADRIVVIKGGTVVEAGSFKTLGAKRDGVFAALLHGLTSQDDDPLKVGQGHSAGGVTVAVRPLSR